MQKELMPSEGNEITNIDFYLTMDCNEKCKHCYALPRYVTPEKIAQKDYPWLDIPLDFIKKTLDEAAEMRDESRRFFAQFGKKNRKLESIGIFGGEPFLRYENLLLPVIEHAVLQGFPINIVTNGFWGIDIEETKQKLDQINNIVQRCAYKASFEYLRKKPIVYTPKVEIDLSCDGMRSDYLIEASANITETFVKGKYPHLSLSLGTMKDIYRKEDFNPKEKDCGFDNRNHNAIMKYFSLLADRGIVFYADSIERNYQYDLFPIITQNNVTSFGNAMSYFPQVIFPLGRSRELFILHGMKKGCPKLALDLIKASDAYIPGQGKQILFVPHKNTKDNSTYIKASYDLRDVPARKKGIVCDNKSLNEIISDLKAYSQTRIAAPTSPAPAKSQNNKHL